jgi:hypothetical protein
MTTSFRHLLYRLRRFLPHDSREAGRMTFHAPLSASTNPETVAEAARIIAPYIADAYSKAGRSTAAGLAKALEVLRALETIDPDK